MSKSKCAVDCFKSGFNCAQAVFSSHSADLGLDEEWALRAAGGFGGGMGHTGQTCGAVTGAYMLIGLKYGKARKDDNAAKVKTYSLVKEFDKRFKELNGSVNCAEILGYDISTDEGLKVAREAVPNIWDTKCAKFVEQAVKIAEELLELK